MKKLYFFFVLLTLNILVLSCNSSVKKNELIASKESNFNQVLRPITQNTRFVVWPDGVVLNELADYESADLMTLPLGTRVEVIGSAKVETEYDGLLGQMLKVDFDGKFGYIFSRGLSVLPIPSFVFEREYYEVGDLKKYAEELKDLGFNMQCGSDDCIVLIFPLETIEETYFIMKLLLPSLLETTPLYRESESESLEDDLDAEERETTFGMLRPKGRDNWSRRVGVYVDVSFNTETKNMEYWSLYYDGSTYSDFKRVSHSARISFERLDNGCKVIFNETER